MTEAPSGCDGERSAAGPLPDIFVVLTGGAGRRLGGVDKARLRVGDTSPLAHVIAIAGDVPIVVAGPSRAGDVPVHQVREDPPGTGPAAGAVAGLTAAARLVTAGGAAPSIVGLWAVDQIGVTRATWRRLTAAVSRRGCRGAVLAAGGRRHYGVTALRLAEALTAAAARPSWANAPLRSLLDPVIDAEVGAVGDEWRDIDTLEDLNWWRVHRAPSEGPHATTREGNEDDDTGGR